MHKRLYFLHYTDTLYLYVFGLQLMESFVMKYSFYGNYLKALSFWVWEVGSLNKLAGWTPLFPNLRV